MQTNHHNRDSLIATLLAWFQFSLLGFNVHTLGSTMFPELGPDLRVLIVYAIFAIGGLARFVGAITLSPLADRIGSGQLLRRSLKLMGWGTLLIGLLPGAQTLGEQAAGLLLLALFALQGVALGGEYTASLSHAVDGAVKQQRGWSSSLTAAGGQIGFLLGSLSTALAIQGLGHAATHAWGWRLPFVVAGLLGLWFSRTIKTTEAKAAAVAQEDRNKSSLHDLGRQWPRILAIAAVATFPLVVFNILFVFFANLQTMETGVLTANATFLTTLVEMLAVPLLLIGGRLGDRFGDRRLTVGACIMLTAVALPATALAEASSVGLFAAQLLVVVPLSLIFSLQGSLLSTWLPKTNRSTVLALGYNVGNLLTAPSLAISSILLKELRFTLGPGVYCLLWALPCLLAMGSLTRAAKTP